MKKIYRQKNRENGWIVNYKTLQQIKDSNIDWSLSMEEIEQVIITLIRLDYLKMYYEINTSTNQIPVSSKPIEDYKKSWPY